MRDTPIYIFDHIGIPTKTVMPNERHSVRMGLYTADHKSNFPIQWHRFKKNSSLHLLIKTLPHIAYRVTSLDLAIRFGY